MSQSFFLLPCLAYIYIIADQQKRKMSDALSRCRVPLSDITNIPSNNNAIATSDTIATNNAVVQMSGNKLIITFKKYRI